MTSTASLDPAEVSRFSAMAAQWWDPAGPLAPLHRLNPTRLAWIRDRIADHFGTDPNDRPAKGLSILDIGCGGGLVTEPLARLGGTVSGIDPAAENIEVARRHAEAGGLAIDYRTETAEALAARGETHDVVLVLEVVEHVADVPAFVKTIGALVRPGGLLLASTINRTLKAWALAIVGAEYVLRWLPRGTHSYDRLVTPNELASALVDAGLEVTAETGVMYVPIADRWRLTGDMDVNYMMAAKRLA